VLVLITKRKLFGENDAINDCSIKWIIIHVFYRSPEISSVEYWTRRTETADSKVSITQRLNPSENTGRIVYEQVEKKSRPDCTWNLGQSLTYRELNQR